LRSGQSRPKAGCEHKGFIYGQALSNAWHVGFMALEIGAMEKQRSTLPRISIDGGKVRGINHA